MTIPQIDDAQLAQVRADLAQLETLLRLAIEKLSASFFGAHRALTRQQAIAGRSAGDAVSHSAGHRASQAAYVLACDAGPGPACEPPRDPAQWPARESACCPECMALVHEACAHLDSALTALQFEDIASQLLASARRPLQQAHDAPAAGRNTSVTQHHMESGGVELF